MKIFSSGRGLNSPEFYRRKKRRARLKLALISVCLLVILCLLVYLSRQERFIIIEATVLEEDITDREEIVSVVQGLLAHHYFWVIPQANALIYPRQAIRQNLLSTFPRIKSVDLKVENLRTLSISVEERVPVAMYCGDSMDISELSGCFLVDGGGFIFATAPDLAHDAYLIYTTQIPIEEPIGKRVTTPEEFGVLSKFISTLTALDVHPATFEIGTDEYTLSLLGGGKIIWRRNANLTLIHSNLEAFLLADAIKAQKNFLDRVLLLDLRIENKIFYRFKN